MLPAAAPVATGLPTWVGTTCQITDGGNHLGVFDQTDHTPVARCARAAKDLGEAALLAMQTPVTMVPAAMSAMQRATKLPVGGYANNPKGAWLDPGDTPNMLGPGSPREPRSSMAAVALDLLISGRSVSAL